MLEKQPLLVHFLFQPESPDARELARQVHTQLNQETVVPGMRVPTMFCPRSADGSPPPQLDFSLAKRNVVVVLSDNQLLLKKDWCRFVADVWQSCDGTQCGFLALQLSANAWPLDERLRGVNFTRAFQPLSAQERLALVTRRIVVELCRFLHELTIGNDSPKAPVKLFLSHAKVDFETEPKVTQQFIATLKSDQPIEAWVDSGQIPSGSEFAKEITRGVQHSSLLVVLTPPITVLYPDPPLGVGESARLAKTRIQVTTPLQRLALQRPLKGKRIALSMSGSTDIERFGLDPLHLEAAVTELSRYLLIQGATLAYGGHLGSQGYTEKLFELVRTYGAESDSSSRANRIVNFRGWPRPRLSVDQLSELDAVSETVELPRPADIDETLHPDLQERPAPFAATLSAVHRFAWARGMTDMRLFQANQAQSGVVARIAVGGAFAPTIQSTEGGPPRKTWYSGRIPGVLEEVVLAARAAQPVFLVGTFGGAARLVIDLLRGIDRPEATWDYQQQAPFAKEMRDIYQQRGLEWLDYPEMVALLRAKGIAGLNPLLTPAEHERLFDSVDPLEMAELILLGLGRLAP
jgi:hypothetical protein